VCAARHGAFSSRRRARDRPNNQARDLARAP
jgi:hypothetical protein